MSIIFFGTPDFSVPTLQSLIDSNELISLVLTQPDRKSGRGRKILSPPVKVIASEHNINVLQPETLKDSSLLDKLMTLSPEFIIVIAYGKILTKEILDIPHRGCINVHASLLPKYRGAAPIQWAIIKGERITGVTTILMDEGMDTGDILLQEEVAIEKSDTSASLSDKLARRGAVVLIDTISGIRKDSIFPSKQKGTPSFAPILKKDNGSIDWNNDAETLFNFIRGMYPWPGAYTHFRGKYIRILHSEPIEGSGHPAKIVRISRDNIYVGTGSGLLAIKSLQPEGKRPLDPQSFVNGYRAAEGDMFD